MGVRVRPRHGEAGLSLFEVAISLAIISIALVPTSQMWQGIAKANDAIGRQAQALVVAQQTLETRVRSVPFDAQKPETGTDAESGLTYTLTLTPLTPTLQKAVVTVSMPSETEPLIRMVTLSAKESNL